MNAYTFATSRPAGFAVVWIVACVVLAAIILAGLLLEYRERRDREIRVREARALRDARLRTFPAGASMRVLRPGERPGLVGGATRARLLGVDELQLEDDFAGFAEYGGALRQ